MVRNNAQNGILFCTTRYNLFYKGINGGVGMLIELPIELAILLVFLDYLGNYTKIPL